MERHCTDSLGGASACRVERGENSMPAAMAPMAKGETVRYSDVRTMD